MDFRTRSRAARRAEKRQHSAVPRARQRSMSRTRDWLTDRLLRRLETLGRRDLGTARQRVRWLRAPLFALMRRRRRIVLRNLELCFPEIEDDARRCWTRAHFAQLAETIAETAFAWNQPGRLGTEIGEVQGLEHLAQARVDGRGVMLLTAHVTCMELGARLFGEQVEAHGIYRPLKNRRLERAQQQGRTGYAEHMIPRDQPRTMARHLRNGGVLWYAPDQDLGPARSGFAPFFGIETATAVALADLARLGRANVVPMYPLKDPESGRITVVLEPHWSPFPSGDMRADLARYNAFLERYIRRHPAQYWWLHRRFKTTPEGEPSRYEERNRAPK